MAKYVLLTLILGGCFWVTPAEREARWDLDGDGIDRPLDCDDQDKEVGGVTWYADVDGDGFGDASITSQECEAPDGYVADGTDCDDGSDAVFPEAEEVCNGADDNCNGLVDDGADVPTWYRDADEDGFGDPSDPVTACEQIEGTVGNADDCDDADAAIRPDADELCNGVDDDCDGDIDLDDLELDPDDYHWFLDGDQDTYGTQDTTIQSCDAPSGYVGAAGDCDDTNPLIHPGMIDDCDTVAVDDNCDGATDNCDDVVNGVIYFADLDGDGSGSALNTSECCQQPGGYVDNANDCDDTDPCVYVGATEICANGVNDDCDLELDEPECSDPADTGACL